MALTFDPQHVCSNQFFVTVTIKVGVPNCILYRVSCEFKLAFTQVTDERMVSNKDALGVGSKKRFKRPRTLVYNPLLSHAKVCEILGTARTAAKRRKMYGDRFLFVTNEFDLVKHEHTIDWLWVRKFYPVNFCVVGPCLI